ncbi:MAG TPA: hypothetical protein PKA50_15460 [Gemmatimonadales bacterium]|nr:hypothetical protein [Gemmatimonadales bacterium]
MIPPVVLAWYATGVAVAIALMGFGCLGAAVLLLRHRMAGAAGWAVMAGALLLAALAAFQDTLGDAWQAVGR